MGQEEKPLVCKECKSFVGWYSKYCIEKQTPVKPNAPACEKGERRWHG